MKAIEGVFPSHDIIKAIKLGYKILEITEVLKFSETSKDPFKDFILKLMKEKIRNSGYPDNVKSDIEKNEYV